MPHVTIMPTVVFPDTHAGRAYERKWEKSEVTRTYLCGDYQPSYKDELCRNRDLCGDPSHSLCHRCTYGFVFDVDRLGLVAR